MVNFRVFKHRGVCRLIDSLSGEDLPKELIFHIRELAYHRKISRTFNGESVRPRLSKQHFLRLYVDDSLVFITLVRA